MNLGLFICHFYEFIRFVFFWFTNTKTAKKRCLTVCENSVVGSNTDYGKVKCTSNLVQAGEYYSNYKNR